MLRPPRTVHVADQGHALITEVDREADPEPTYLRRVLREAEDCDRVVVMGPDSARIAFEREFVALYRRPDRLMDPGPSRDPVRSQLVDQLRVLDPTLH